MIESTGTWRNVMVGSYIKDKTGKTWKVTGFGSDNPMVFLVDKDGKKTSIVEKPPGDPVQILLPTHEEKAVALISSELGGTIVGWNTHGEQEWVAPTHPPGEHITVSRAGADTSVSYHLKIFHGIYPDALPDEEAKRVYHLEIHSSKQPMAVNHRHSS